MPTPQDVPHQAQDFLQSFAEEELRIVPGLNLNLILEEKQKSNIELPSHGPESLRDGPEAGKPFKRISGAVFYLSDWRDQNT